MGKILSMACEQLGRSVLLAGAGIRGVSQASSRGEARAKDASYAEGAESQKAISTKKARKNRANVKGDSSGSNRAEGHRQNDRIRRSARGDEGGDGEGRRSAQELEIVWIGHECSDSPTGAHWLIGDSDAVDRGFLFKCKFCHRYKWLPIGTDEALTMGELMRKYGEDIGYQKMLDRKPAAKVLVAKLQELRRLRGVIKYDMEFVEEVERILKKRG
ncbi:hypothetical protein LCGC14_2465150, partial [marine sediment metagenome]